MIDKLMLSKLSEFLGVVAVMMIAGTTGKILFKPVEFQYPKRERNYSIILYSVILLISVGMFSDIFPEGIFMMEAPLNLLQREFTLALLAVICAGLLLTYRKQPFLSAGWGKKINLRNGMRMGLMLVFLTIFLRGKIFALIDGVSANEGIALALCLGIALAEESVFRGYLQLRAVSWLGKPRGWLVVSLAFIIWRLPILFFHPAGIWMGLLILVIQSLLLGWIMEKSGHVLAPALYRGISDWLLFI